MKLLSFCTFVFILFSCSTNENKKLYLLYGFEIGMDYEEFYLNVNRNIQEEKLILYDYTPPPLILGIDTFSANPYKKIKIKLSTDQKDLMYWSFEPIFFNDKLLYIQLLNDSIQDLERVSEYFDKIFRINWQEKETLRYKTISLEGYGFILEKSGNGGMQLSIVDKVQYDLRNSIMEKDNTLVWWNENGDSWTKEYNHLFKNDLISNRISKYAR